MTVSITVLFVKHGIMSLSIKTLTITTFSIVTISIMVLFATLGTITVTFY